jgi:hypothetical protein
MSAGFKDRKIAALLALISSVRWGIVYLLLSWTPIPKVASVFEGLWYLFQDREEFDHYFNSPDSTPVGAVYSASVTPSIAPNPTEIATIAEVLRQFEQLRQDGLMSDYEFEQKRRQLLDRLG